MENYNFLPEIFYEKRKIKKLKKYKILILTLWIISLFLFTIYVFNLNKCKLINEKIKSNINSKIDITIKESKEGKTDNNTLTTFKVFYEDIDGKLPYSIAAINNKEINLELTIGESEQYYKIVDNFDNKANYNIIYVSPLSNDNDIYKFRLISEVRP
jgi:hypothetical protein